MSSPNDSASLATYTHLIGAHDLLTEEEEWELARRIADGDEAARERLAICNLRLVVHVAKSFAIPTLPISDIISEGNIGLLRAVDKFEPDRGRFSTYAVWWIRQSIQRAIGNQSRTIRLPIHMIEKITAIQRVAFGLQEEIGREPSAEEIADRAGICREKVERYLLSAQSIVSMHGTHPDGDSSDMGDWCFPSADLRPDELCDQADIVQYVSKLVATLPEKEAMIIKRRFGLAGHDARTLEEIGADIGLTRERVRQIQVKAIETLRCLAEGRTPGTKKKSATRDSTEPDSATALASADGECGDPLKPRRESALRRSRRSRSDEQELPGFQKIQGTTASLQ